MVFRPSAAFLLPDEEGTSLVAHYLCGWGIPVLVPMITIAANYIDLDEKIEPKLGGTNCLYEDEFAILSFLGIPLVALTLISIFFYVLTAVNLRNALGNSGKAKTVRRQLNIHVKLLCIMLVTWTFGLISPFAEYCILDFIFLVLMSLQGLFVFISFIKNKKVCSEVRTSLKKRILLRRQSGFSPPTVMQRY